MVFDDFDDGDNEEDNLDVGANEEDLIAALPCSF